MKKLIVIGLAIASATTFAQQLVLTPQNVPLAATLTPAQTAAALADINPLFSSNNVPAGYYVAQINATQSKPTGTNAYGATRLTVLLKPIAP